MNLSTALLVIIQHRLPYHIAKHLHSGRFKGISPAPLTRRLPPHDKGESPLPRYVLSDDDPCLIDICLRDIANALGEELVCNLEQVVVPGIIAKHMGNLAHNPVFQMRVDRPHLMTIRLAPLTHNPSRSTLQGRATRARETPNSRATFASSSSSLGTEKNRNTEFSYRYFGIHAVLLPQSHVSYREMP